MASYIKGTGSFLPKEKVSNKELSDRLGVDEEWIFQRTVIVERRKSSFKGVVDMAFLGVQSAIEMVRLKKEEGE